MSTLQNSDKFLVSRSNSTQTVTAQNLMASLQNTDLMVVQRGTTTYVINGQDVKSSIGTSGIAPTISQISASPAFAGGTGTQSDPFVLTAASLIPAGASGTSSQTITISGASANTYVIWTDLNSSTNGARFDQPFGITNASGNWSGTIHYADSPSSTADTIYTASLKIGDAYFSWQVTQTVAYPIDFSPVITGSRFVGDTLNASAGTITGGVAPQVEGYSWAVNGVATGDLGVTRTIIASDVGQTISCVITCAEPDGSNAVSKTATFSQTPAYPSSISQPSVTAPPDGSGVGGDVTYTPKTSAVTNVTTSGSNVVLTLTNSKSYNNSTGADMNQPISDTFTSGQSVQGILSGSSTATGVLASDASGSSMTITPTGTNISLTSLGANPSQTYQGVTKALQSDGYEIAAYSKSLDLWVAVNSAGGTYTYPTWKMAGNQLSSGWQNGATGIRGRWTRCIWAGTRFVACGYLSINYYIQVSNTTATSWSHGTVSGSNTFSGYSVPIDLAYDDVNDVVVMLSQGGGSWYSSDNGQTWTLSNLNTLTSRGDKVIFDGTYFLAFAYGNVYRSSDGASWSDLGTKFPGYSQNVTAVDAARGSGSTDQIVVYYSEYSGGRKPYSSTDHGSTWTAGTRNDISSNVYAFFKSIHYIGNSNGTILWVGATSSNLYKSTDGVNWTVDISGSQGNLLSDADWSYSNHYPSTLLTVGTSTSYGSLSANPFLTNMVIVNNTTATKTGPDAGYVELVGSAPVSVNITTWGDATWEVATNSSFTSSITTTKAISNASATQTLAPSERGSIVIGPSTQYWARVKYSSTSPAITSSYSSSITFETSSSTAGWTAP